MPKPTVFLSYTHSPGNRAWVRELADSLTEQGVGVWLDVAQIKPGESVSEAIDRGLRSSDAIVAVLDSADLRRPSVLFELGAAFGMDKRIIPIVGADVNPSDLPSAVRTRQFIWRGDAREAAALVASALIQPLATESEAA